MGNWVNIGKGFLLSDSIDPTTSFIDLSTKSLETGPNILHISNKSRRRIIYIHLWQTNEHVNNNVSYTVARGQYISKPPLPPHRHWQEKTIVYWMPRLPDLCWNIFCPNHGWLTALSFVTRIVFLVVEIVVVVAVVVIFIGHDNAWSQHINLISNWASRPANSHRSEIYIASKQTMSKHGISDEL